MSGGAKLLYVAGMPRSGTTLLDNLLNELTGFVSIGELRSLWIGLLEGRLCGCGKPIGDCPFWKAVVERAGPPAADGEHVLELQRQVRSLPTKLVRMRLQSPRSDSAPARYARLLSRVYGAVADVSGARVIVDSSKGPHDLYAVERFTGLRPYAVQLVRDPRGVVHSWSKEVPDRGAPGGALELARGGTAEVAGRWVSRNLLIGILLGRRLGDRFMRLRYEELAATPERSLERICSMLAEPCAGLEFEGPGRVLMRGNHTVSGNPRRLEREATMIREDTEWATALPRSSRLGTTLLTLPLMRRYGYRPDRGLGAVESERTPPQPVVLNQLARYAPILRLIRESSGSSLLDVGSGSSGIGTLIGPPWEVTAVDLEFTDYGERERPGGQGVRRVTGDVRELPFEDRSFDLVVALDVLEHLEPEDRSAAIAEIARVARRRLVLAFPAGEVARESDRRLSERYELRGLLRQRWLQEHLAHQFPEPDRVADQLRSWGRVSIMPNESIGSHALVMRLESRRPGASVSRALSKALADGADRRGPRSGLLALLRGLDRSPAYRAIVVADRDRPPATAEPRP